MTARPPCWRPGTATDVPPNRPHVLLSAAMSLDGCIDDTSPERLVLSDAADLDRVDEARAGVDAILVGATTLRRDDPRLLVRSAARRAVREADGRAPHPLKVTISGSGELDPGARFFATGDGEKLVYVPSAALGRATATVGGRATIVDAGQPLDLHLVLADLRARGVARLMVEGGTSVLTQFLAAGLVDEIHLVVAPMLVGDPGAPRFVGPGAFPPRRLRLAEARPMGDLVLLRYQVEAIDG